MTSLVPEIIFNEDEIGVEFPVPEVTFDTWTFCILGQCIELIRIETIGLEFDRIQGTFPNPLPAALFTIRDLGAFVIGQALDFFPLAIQSLSALADFVTDKIHDMVVFAGMALDDIREWVVGIIQHLVAFAGKSLDDISDWVTDIIFDVVALAGKTATEIANWVTDLALGAVRETWSFLTDMTGFVTDIIFRVVALAGKTLAEVAKWVKDLAVAAVTAAYPFLRNMTEFILGAVDPLLPDEFVADAANWVFWTFWDQMTNHVTPAVAGIIKEVVEGFLQLLLSEETKQKTREAARKARETQE